jgi:hypothetical protein
MRKQTLRIMTALVGAVLSFAGALQAQYVPHYVKVSVPFEFTVGNTLLPAGDYKFACTPSAVELRDARGQLVASAVHHSVQSADTPVPPKLVFTTDSGGHALRQIWPGSSNYGYELAPSNSAIIMAKHHSNPPVPVGGGGNK